MKAHKEEPEEEKGEVTSHHEEETQLDESEDRRGKRQFRDKKEKKPKEKLVFKRKEVQPSSTDTHSNEAPYTNQDEEAPS